MEEAVRIIKIDLKNRTWGSGLVRFCQSKDGCWALVNMVMDLRVPEKAGNFLTTCASVASEEEPVIRGVNY
jgi:hypothetical protein